MTIEDIYLIVVRIIDGYYDDIYGRLDGPKIMSWFRKYSDERLEIAEEFSYQNHEGIKQNSFRNEKSLSIDDIKQMYNEFIKSGPSKPRKNQQNSSYTEKEKQKKTHQMYVQYIQGKSPGIIERQTEQEARELAKQIEHQINQHQEKQNISGNHANAIKK